MRIFGFTITGQLSCPFFVVKMPYLSIVEKSEVLWITKNHFYI